MPGSRPERVRMKSSASISTRSPASALCELPAGRAVEHQFEGLAVDTGPFSHDVRNEPAVVIGRELHGAIDCRVNVDPMRPDVPGESDVEQVFQGSPSDGWPEWERDVACGRRCAPPALDRPGADRSNVRDELIVRESVALANLQLVHAVNPVVRVDLLVERHSAPQLVNELSHRRLGFGRAEDMQHHLTNVPTRTVRGRFPLLGREARDQVCKACELLLGQHLGLGTSDPIRFH